MLKSERASLIVKASMIRAAVEAVNRTDVTQCRNRSEAKKKRAEMADQVMPLLRRRIDHGQPLPEVVVDPTPTETRKRGAPSTKVPKGELLSQILRQVVMHLKPELVLELAELMRPKWASK